MIRKKLLIFTEYFLPAKKGGGPVSSIRNLVELLHNDFEIGIICFNHDMNSSEKLNGIASNSWNNWKNKANVYYIDKKQLSKKNIYFIIDDFQPNTIYLNSIFIPQFVIYPIWMAKKIDAKIVIAPRGMLQEGAINNKPLKKAIYFHFLKFINIFNNTYWHATDIQESSDIRNIFLKKNISIVNNIPIAPKNNFNIEKLNKLTLIYISLITEKKNLIFLLNTLSKIKNSTVELDIYGPIKDVKYWDECKIIITTLPKNIKVRYKGEVDPNEVTKVISNYNLFVLPTLGENFGHAIFESLASGVPVLISDKTPWRNLETKNIGYDLPLKESIWTNAIDLLNIEKLNQMRYDSQIFAKKYFEKGNFKEKYLKLFNH